MDNLRLEVNNYENTKLIFMNFSVDEKNRVWGLPEGEKTQYLLTTEKLEDYKQFLLNAIKVYTRLADFFTTEYEYHRKVRKYTNYLNRLEKLKDKIGVSL